MGSFEPLAHVISLHKVLCPLPKTLLLFASQTFSLLIFKPLAKIYSIALHPDLSSAFSSELQREGDTGLALKVLTVLDVRGGLQANDFKNTGP